MMEGYIFYFIIVILICCIGVFSFKKRRKQNPWLDIFDEFPPPLVCAECKQQIKANCPVHVYKGQSIGFSESAHNMNCFCSSKCFNKQHPQTNKN